MKRDIKRAESYIESSDWLKNKGTTIYPKNKKDNKCFQYAITSGLNYNKIKKKYLKKIEKFKQVDRDFSSHHLKAPFTIYLDLECLLKKK